MANQAELDEARKALHDLLLGKKAIKLQQNGRSVEYQQADVEKLKTYVSELSMQLGSATTRRRPLGVK
tara:strand:- start:7491 stop:7694 length:204 start_codon:yes stop_codon:yes gene_type:complete